MKPQWWKAMALRIVCIMRPARHEYTMGLLYWTCEHLNRKPWNFKGWRIYGMFRLTLFAQISASVCRNKLPGQTAIKPPKVYFAAPTTEWCPDPRSICSRTSGAASQTASEDGSRRTEAGGWEQEAGWASDWSAGWLPGSSWTARGHKYQPSA